MLTADLQRPSCVLPRPQDKKRIARKKKEAAEAAAAAARAAAGVSDEPDAKNMLDEVVDEDVIF